MSLVWYDDGVGNSGLLSPDGASLTDDLTCCCGEAACGDCPYGTPQMGPPSDPVVDTLYARITNVVGCECLDGLCVPMTWLGEDHASGGSWSGTVPVDCTSPMEQFITIALQCCGEDGWMLGTDDCTEGEDAGHGGTCPTVIPPIVETVAVEPGWTCRPYNMTFKNLPGLTCCGESPSLFDVEVTETPC